MHDLIIRGGTIADGSGRPTATGDVAVDGSIVTAVGEVEGPARREIDAEGLLVTPGLGRHPHPLRRPGHLGPGGLAVGLARGHHRRHGQLRRRVRARPAQSDRAWLIQLMEGVEDIPGTALAEGMNWNWETFGEYLDEVERTRPRARRGRRSSRTAPCGPTCSARGGPTTRPPAEEIAEMAALVREAVQAGAIGASTTRTILHRAKDGELAAGTNAAADELIAIGEALGQGGAPGLLGGQRHVGPRPRVRLDVGDLACGPACP